MAGGYPLVAVGGMAPAGNSVEVFVASTGQHCKLADLPGRPIFHHTIEEKVLCGNHNNDANRKSCLTLTDGKWQTTPTLLEQRS